MANGRDKARRGGNMRVRPLERRKGRTVGLPPAHRETVGVKSKATIDGSLQPRQNDAHIQFSTQVSKATQLVGKRRVLPALP